MVTRTTLLMMALVSTAALAGSRASPSSGGGADRASDAKAQPPAEPRVVIGATPREINIVDDVGVGDHFPSHVPGSAPYRLPPREMPAPPPPSEARAEPAQPIASPPIASQPGEWATIETSPQPQLVQTLTAPPQPAVAPVAPVAPPQSAPAAVEQVAPDLERETLGRASDSLLQGSCETELPRLAELIDRTDRAAIKARAQILRARCFSQRAKPEKAKAEYLGYLRDNPNGAWAAEAREVTGAQ